MHPSFGRDHPAGLWWRFLNGLPPHSRPGKGRIDLPDPNHPVCSVVVRIAGLTGLLQSVPDAFFPQAHLSIHNSEQGVCVRNGQLSPLGQGCRISYRQFLLQVPPLEQQLACCLLNQQTNRRRMADSGGIKVVSSPSRLFQDACQITGYGATGIRAGKQTEQLWVPAVPPGFTTQHGLRQQRLPPQSDKALGVKIPGMECPKSHG